MELYVHFLSAHFSQSHHMPAHQSKHSDPVPTELLCSGHVVHIKGRTSDVEDLALMDALRWLNRHLLLARDKGVNLLIIWDGDAIMSNAYTGVLELIAAKEPYVGHEVDPNLEIEVSNACGDVSIVYGGHWANVHGSFPPRNLENVASELQIWSLLCESDNPRMCSHFESFSQVEERRDRAYTMMMLFGEEYGTRDSDGRFQTNYGYWVLGTAILSITKSKHIAYIGGGDVCVAEYLTNQENNTIIEQAVIGWSSIDALKLLAHLSYLIRRA